MAMIAEASARLASDNNINEALDKKSHVSMSDCPQICSSEALHVLAVDDSIIDRKIVEKLLKSFAFKVTVADSASRALELLGIDGPSTINVNMIITDYCMPGMSGYDLLKQVKESSALKGIPVVIMSSENVPDRIERCLAGGAEDFIMKPLQLADVNRLKSHIRQLNDDDQASTSLDKRKLSSDYHEQKPKKQRRIPGVTVAYG